MSPAQPKDDEPEGRPADAETSVPGRPLDLMSNRSRSPNMSLHSVRSKAPGLELPAQPERRRAANESNRLALEAENRRKSTHRWTEAQSDGAIDLIPRRAPRRRWGAVLSFLACVALPLVAVAVYYWDYASPQYEAEFRFSVRDAKAAAVGSKDVGGFAAVMGAAAAPNSLENYMVVEYLTSKDAVETMQSRIDVRSRYSGPAIDWVARFDNRQPIEAFVRYWRRQVDIGYDQVTGIATARVKAFTAEDADLIAKTLVKMAEELIDRIATRPQRDAIKFAAEELKLAEDRLKNISSELTKFRNVEQVIDPQSNVVSSNVLLAQTLRASLAQLQTELASLKKQNLPANAPVNVVLQSRIKATREQLAAVEAQVGGFRDGANPLSKVVGDYERLDLERQFAQEMVKSTMRALEDARMTAAGKHMYVTVFVPPTLPESATHPKRIQSILIAGLFLLLFWTLGLFFVRSVREHIS